MTAIGVRHTGEIVLYTECYPYTMHDYVTHQNINYQQRFKNIISGQMHLTVQISGS